MSKKLNASQGPRPNFDTKEIAKQVALGRGSSSQDVESLEELTDTTVINETFENWLQEFAGLWDSSEAMEADAPEVWERWGPAFAVARVDL